MSAGPSALLLDTHAAIWLAEGQLDEAASAAIVQAGLAGGVFVSPVSAWEIGLLARPKAATPILFLPDPATWFARLMAQPIIKPAPLTPSAAIAASFLPDLPHNDPADRLLIATAREMNVPLMTRDRIILSYAKGGHLKVFPI